MKIDNKEIGENQPCFIIAEVGINHNGDLNIAKKMIDAAVEAKCDAVKFQTFKAKLMYPKTAGNYETDGKVLQIHNAMKKFELPIEWLKELQEYCKNKNISFFSSVSDIWSVDIMEEHNVCAFKTTSYDTTNLPLLEHIAKKNKPIVMSVGAAYLGEVEEAVNTIKKHNNQLAILHCVTKYPAPEKYCNINVIKTLKLAFPGYIIGYSDHTEDPIKAPIAAVVKGAKIIEKHFTLDKTIEGPDQRFAVNPEQLKQMVKAIKETEEKLKKDEKVEVDPIILGSSKKEPTEIEIYVRNFAYRSIFASKEIKANEKITKENIEILRNGENKSGLKPKYYNQLIEKGYKVIKDIKEGKPITWDHFISS